MTVMVLALATAMQAGGAPVVEIENFIGTVRVVEGATLDARIENSGETRADIRNSGGELAIDGRRHPSIHFLALPLALD